MTFLGSKIQQCYKTKISKMVNFTSSAVNKQCWLKKGIGCLKNKLQLLLSLYLNDEIGYSTVLKPFAYLKCF